MSWNEEEIRCIDARARTVLIPEQPGVESERVPVLHVLRRKIWFPDVGVYMLRDGERVVYVGSTNLPLRVRLQSAIYTKKSWTRADYGNWTVTMQRMSEWPDPRKRERELVAEHQPVFNISGRGRPRKPKPVDQACRCKGPCPECGLSRGA